MNPEYYLPGVFSEKYLGANINISIRTMPFEVMSYLFIAIVGIFTIMGFTKMETRG